VRNERTINRMRERIIKRLRELCHYDSDLDAHLDANLILLGYLGYKIEKRKRFLLQYR
jgi:hypothetical protein